LSSPLLNASLSRIAGSRLARCSTSMRC
jgi:hypothetical protein